MIKLKEIFRRDTVSGIQVLGPGWLILYLTLLVLILGTGALLIWVF